MITKEEVLQIHEEVLKLHGGSSELREPGAPESAIARPYQTFGGEDLYPAYFKKGAAFSESIIMNHPFIDGNKRTGYVLMETMLRLHGYKISAPDEELYQFVIDISTGTKRFEEIVEWLKINSKTL